MTASSPAPVAWQVRGARLTWPESPLLMGILNTTPDSFSDGGLFVDPAAAEFHARACVQEGAVIIDVGGESTRPGAQRIPAEEQLQRTRPVVEAIAHAPWSDGVFISIDTTRASVARAALAAGAHIVNDVSAGTEEPEILDAVAQAGAGVVLMHRVAPPDADHYSDQHPRAPAFNDVVRQVRDWLLERAQTAQRAGVGRSCIALDPGLGFGKNVEQNFQLVAELHVLVQEGYPVVIGASRKSFIGAATGVQKPSERVAGSIAVGLAAATQGAAVLRVHDVGEHARALKVWSKTHQARGSGGRGERHAPDGLGHTKP